MLLWGMVHLNLVYYYFAGVKFKSVLIYSVRGILCESTVILFERLQSSDNDVIPKTPFLFVFLFLLYCCTIKLQSST